MSGAAEHQRFQEDAGAYALGALDDGETDAFELHLETCHVCQDEVDRLRTAASALPRSVEQYAPPPALKVALMQQVYAEAEAGSPADTPRARAPRRSLADRLGLAFTPRLAFAATAAALAIGVVLGVGISQLGNGRDAGAQDTQRQVAATVDTSRVGSGKATLVLRGGAGELRLSSMPQPRAGQVYEVWLERDGRVEPASLFSVDQNGNGVGAVPGSLDGVTRVMVTRERRGGARQPTEAPVVTAEV